MTDSEIEVTADSWKRPWIEQGKNISQEEEAEINEYCKQHHFKTAEEERETTFMGEIRQREKIFKKETRKRDGTSRRK